MLFIIWSSGQVTKTKKCSMMSQKGFIFSEPALKGIDAHLEWSSRHEFNVMLWWFKKIVWRNHNSIITMKGNMKRDVNSCEVVPLGINSRHTMLLSNFQLYPAWLLGMKWLVQVWVPGHKIWEWMFQYWNAGACWIFATMPGGMWNMLKSNSYKCMEFFKVKKAGRSSNG